MKLCFPKKSIWLIIIFFIALPGRNGPGGSEVSSRNGAFQKIVHVIDGDTVILEDGRHVRYIGINCPEVAHRDKPGEPFGKAAKEWNRNFVAGRSVRIEHDEEKTDRYGRTLAYVFRDDGEFVNARLVNGGMAFCLYDKKNHKYADTLLRTQRDAISENRGIWNDPDLTKPRKLIGNQASRRFHEARCETAKRIAKRNRRIFQNRREAFLEGYAPSKICFFGR